MNRREERGTCGRSSLGDEGQRLRGEATLMTGGLFTRTGIGTRKARLKARTSNDSNHYILSTS